MTSKIFAYFPTPLKKSDCYTREVSVILQRMQSVSRHLKLTGRRSLLMFRGMKKI